MNGQEELLRCYWLLNEQDGDFLAALDYPMKNVSKSHIINPLLTKLVRSRWLDIGLILFSLDHSLKLHVKEKYENADGENLHLHVSSSIAEEKRESE